MATSQNGWGVIFDASGTQRWTIGDTGRGYNLRPGHAGFVLACLVLWFHRVIERIDPGVWDEWGWAVRPIRGQTSGYSNHASATAVDINAVAHPIGRSGTFKHAWQYTKIKARMVWCLGVLRWGGGWSRPDEMHFEIATASQARVARLARRWARTSVGKAILDANPFYTAPVVYKAGSRNLRKGDRGQDVRVLQRRLKITVDGVYGEATAEAVRRFERSKKQQYPALKVDGTVGKVTWRALGIKTTY